MTITNITPRETELQKQVIELAESLRNIGWEFELYKKAAIEALRAELDKPEPEPVAFICRGNLYFWPSEDEFCDQKDSHILLYTKGSQNV